MINFLELHNFNKKTAKDFVNIACKINSDFVGEEFSILKNAKGVMENFAKKNNIDVDIFFKDAKVDDIYTQMVDISVKNRKTGDFAQKNVIYKRNGESVEFVAKKPVFRLVKAENREYEQTVKTPPMEITVYDRVNEKVSKQKLDLPDTKIYIKEYNNYSVPKKVGESVVEDGFLRHVYRIIEQLSKTNTKK